MVFYWLSAFLFRIFAKLFFQLKIEGRENLPKKGGFIIAANHSSSLDPFILTAVIPCYIRWIVVYEYYDLWYLKWILRKMRFIRIENNLPKEAFGAITQGETVGFFPEGRRTWTGNLGPARRGVATLARITSCPVVPVAILGTFAVLPRTRKRLKISPITVRIGTPLFFSAVCTKDREVSDNENAQRLMCSIARLMETT
jgi:1-acyl-sn-glycerol-3-phosphate acyltransferase